MRFPARIRTERLELRELVAADVDPLAEIYADAEAMRFLGGPRTRKQACDEIAEVVAGYEMHGLGPRAIVSLKRGAFLGRCGVEMCMIDGEARFEVGFLLAPGARRRGYATEAVKAICDAAFQAGISPLVALVDRDNGPSVAVLRRVGMSFARDVLHMRREMQLFELAQPAGV